jgi:hypothetical protein
MSTVGTFGEVVDRIRAHAGPIWVTRDRCPIAGSVDDICDVWSVRPERADYGVWFMPMGLLIGLEEPAVHAIADRVHIGRLSRALVEAHIGTCPDDDLQCIRRDG